MNWESLHWKTLDRLRALFLAETPPPGTYWTSWPDLANYDFTFAQRIAWKWDAVHRELHLRGWTPPTGAVLDWGCGSGIAGRRVVDFFGPEQFQVLRFHDHSPLAMDFAVDAARQEFPQLPVEKAEAARLTGLPSIGLLVLSHVLNELSAAERESLLTLAARAEAILWVEPGTHAGSRDLIPMRERLRGTFEVIAPCTHQAPCGLLAPENAPHWCHHFALPPPAIMADADWVGFAQRVGIDLRHLPYSFLILERRDVFARRSTGRGALGAGWSRVVGVPRFYKPLAKILSCQADGVREFMLQKRDAPDLFKELKGRSEGLIYQWTLSGERVKAARALGRPPAETA